MGLRVAFTGASGTGKSTLAKIVSERLGIPMNPIGSRSVSQAMGFASPYDVDRAGKRAEFQRRLLTEKIAWEREHESFVVDRTTLDNLTYTALHDVYAVDERVIGDVEEGLFRYSHVIYCPVRSFCDAGDDPTRVKSRVYQDVYDTVLMGFLLRYRRGCAGGTGGESFRTLSTPDLDERVGDVLRYIGR